MRIQKQAADADVVIIFFRKSAALSRELPELAAMTAQGPALVGAVAEEGIRRRKRPDHGAHSRDGLALGLVDYKVCAVDATWSAMTLGKRRRK